MNLVRLHYADGSVESFRPTGPVAAHYVRRRETVGLRGAGRVVARTDAFGAVVGDAIAPYLAVTARWSAEVRFAQAYFVARGADDLEDEEPFEHKPDGAWLAIAVVGLLILAVMVGSAVGSVGS